MEIVPPFWVKAGHEKQQAGLPVCTFSAEYKPLWIQLPTSNTSDPRGQWSSICHQRSCFNYYVLVKKSCRKRKEGTGILQQHSSRPLTRIPLILVLKKVFKQCLKTQMLKQNELIILSIPHTQKVTLQLCVAKIVRSKVWRQMTSRRNRSNTYIVNKRQMTFPEKWLSEIKKGGGCWEHSIKSLLCRTRA